MIWLFISIMVIPKSLRPQLLFRDRTTHIIALRTLAPSREKCGIFSRLLFTCRLITLSRQRSSFTHYHRFNRSRTIVRNLFYDSMQQSEAIEENGNHFSTKYSSFGRILSSQISISMCKVKKFGYVERNRPTLKTRMYDSLQKKIAMTKALHRPWWFERYLRHVSLRIRYYFVTFIIMITNSFVLVYSNYFCVKIKSA